METEKAEKKTVNVLSLKKEMDEFKADVGQKFDTVKSLLEELVNKDKKENVLRVPQEETTVNQSTPVASASSNARLTIEQQTVFEKYFDPADGFTASYNILESIFTISVPMSLSNANDAYKQYYKTDLRAKKVDQNNPLGSIDSWCALVAQNLKYDKKIKIKL